MLPTPRHHHHHRRHHHVGNFHTLERQQKVMWAMDYGGVGNKAAMVTSERMSHMSEVSWTSQNYTHIGRSSDMWQAYAI